MKKLLFSRSQKKHFSDTVVRIGKNNLGFSLVELIVIIAIMAVLVAIAIPVLGMFIEKAKIANDKQAVNDVMYAIDLASEGMNYQNGNSGLAIPIGFVVLTNTDGVQIIGSNSTNDSNFENYNELYIKTALENALGQQYLSSSSLAFDEWRGSNIPTLYNDTSELYEKVKTTSNSVVEIMTNSSISQYADSLGLRFQDYETGSTGADVVAQIAVRIAEKYTDEQQFIDVWTNQSSVFTQNSGFGLECQEDYMAIRTAYNEAVASYVETSHSSEKGSEHATHIRNFTELDIEEKLVNNLGSLAGGAAALIVEPIFKSKGLVVPGTIRENIFDNDKVHEDHGWLSKCTYCDDEAGFLNDSVQRCTECKTAVTNYNSSTVAHEDARAFYKMMVSFANSYADGETSWDDYDSYIANMNAVYQELSTLTAQYDESGVSYIILSVYQDEKTGVLYTECNTPGVLDE